MSTWAGVSFSVDCDEVNCFESVESTEINDAIHAAVCDGWTHTDDTDWCPRHAADRS